MAAWPSTPGDELIRLFRGFWLSRAIYVAAELGIADLLVDGPRPVGDRRLHLLPRRPGTSASHHVLVP